MRSPASGCARCHCRLRSGLRLLGQKARLGGLFVLLLAFAGGARAQDYEKEKRWSDDILKTLMVGDAAWITQKNGHRFLGLYTAAEKPRGAAIIAHGRGWSPDFELYGSLRTKLAEAGYSTLSIQLPVLPSTAILGLYVPLYPDARERFQLAVDFLKAKGYRNIAIVSHSLGATMANQYLIRTDDTSVGAWVFIGILQGLEEMYRIKIPVLDVFGSDDFTITMWGADERRKQIVKNPASRQVMVKDAKHFFEGREDELVGIVVGFLDRAFSAARAD
jgi:alpha-beta hydrolase superfamily lysophospholipase